MVFQNMFEKYCTAGVAVSRWENIVPAFSQLLIKGRLGRRGLCGSLRGQERIRHSTTDHAEQNAGKNKGFHCGHRFCCLFWGTGVAPSHWHETSGEETLCASFPDPRESVSHAAQINCSGGIFGRMPVVRAVFLQAWSKNTFSGLSGFMERFLCS